MQQNKKSSESGNVFVIILAGIVLFSALMFVFSKGGEQGSGNLTKQQSKISAQSLLNSARLLESAVDKVRRKGCSESDISFENAVIAGYSNPNAPGDKSCHIFNIAGGNVDDQSFFGGEIQIKNFIVTSVEGVGSTEKELIWTDGLNSLRQICLEINNLQNIENPGNDLPGPDDNTWTQYAGDFGAGPAAGSDTGSIDGITQLEGKNTGCYKNGANDAIFYHVLLAR